MSERECVRERQRGIDDNDDTRATNRARLIVYFF